MRSAKWPLIRASSPSCARPAASAPQPTSIMKNGTSGAVNKRISAITQSVQATAMAISSGTTTTSMRTG
ncbi:hypothetical protein D3C71_1958900 [compost metagenome]